MRINLSKNRTPAIFFAICLSLSIIFITGIIPKWGRWYSNHLAPRRQVQGLLQGHLGMVPTPSGMGWDLAWDDGAVQQVWGLGVPFWQLPFEAVAKVFGNPPFPDRITFVIALVGIIYAIVRFHFSFGTEIVAELKPGFSLLGPYAITLFPPFLALCTSRFLVYEEVVAYGYLLGLLLMTWTAWLWLRPSLKSFYGLALVSGLIIFVRPTFGVYGFASLALGCVAVWKIGFRIRACLLGIVLFCLGIGLLLWLNNLRFGSPLEFGYSLNVNSLGAMVYAQRFGSPYHKVPLIEAAKELFGLLFLTRAITRKPEYGLGLFPLESNGFRWRELYFSTYDLSVFLMLTIALGWLLGRLLLLWKRKVLPGQLGCLEVVAIWSMMAFVPLAGFYLRFPFISSRYLLDFGPAFVAECWVFLGLALRAVGLVKRRTSFVKVLLSISIVGWFTYEIMSMKVSESSRPFNRQELAERMGIVITNSAKRVQIPLNYTNGFAFDDSGIAYNGEGWDPKTGQTGACVVVYVENPDCLTLDVTTTNNINTPLDKFSCIEVKIGLEQLQRKRINRTSAGVRITFNGPTIKRYQTGIQQACLAMVAPDDLSDGNSKFRLLKVEWHGKLATVAAAAH